MARNATCEHGFVPPRLDWLGTPVDWCVQCDGQPPALPQRIERIEGQASARELASLLDVAKHAGYGISRCKLASGAELALYPLEPERVEAKPRTQLQRNAGEAEEAFAARHAEAEKLAATREAHVARYAKEMGRRRAEGFVDACLANGGVVP